MDKINETENRDISDFNVVAASALIRKLRKRRPPKHSLALDLCEKYERAHGPVDRIIRQKIKIYISDGHLDQANLELEKLKNIGADKTLCGIFGDLIDAYKRNDVQAVDDLKAKLHKRINEIRGIGHITSLLDKSESNAAKKIKKLRKGTGVNNFNRAVSMAEEYLKHYPASPLVRIQLSHCYRMMGQYEVARVLAQQVVEEMPHKKYGYMALAEIDINEGKLEDAESKLLECSKGDEKTRSVLSMLARISIEKAMLGRAKDLIDELAASEKLEYDELLLMKYLIVNGFKFENFFNLAEQCRERNGITEKKYLDLTEGVGVKGSNRFLDEYDKSRDFSIRPQFFRTCTGHHFGPVNRVAFRILNNRDPHPES